MARRANLSKKSRAWPRAWRCRQATHSLGRESDSSMPKSKNQRNMRLRGSSWKSADSESLKIAINNAAFNAR